MFFTEKRKLHSIIFITFGYLLILIFLGVHNYSRSNVFYVTSTQAKIGFWMYLIPQVLSKSNKIEINESYEILNNKIKKWKKQNDFSESDMEIEKNKLLLAEYKKNESMKIMLNNFFVTSSIVLKNSLHFIVFDPLGHTYYFHKYDYKTPAGIGYWKSKEHQFWIIPRIIYSLLIYLISLIGLYNLSNNKEKKYIFLVLACLLYFTLVQSWIGNNRYSTPNLIFLSILFSFGLNNLYNLFKKIRLKKENSL